MIPNAAAPPLNSHQCGTYRKSWTLVTRLSRPFLSISQSRSSRSSSENEGRSRRQQPLRVFSYSHLAWLSSEFDNFFLADEADSFVASLSGLRCFLIRLPTLLPGSLSARLFLLLSRVWFLLGGLLFLLRWRLLLRFVAGILFRSQDILHLLYRH